MRFVTCILVFGLFVSLGGAGCASVEGNRYNPYVHSRLPSSELVGDSAVIAESIGARASSLQDEAKHRPHWKEEVYPVVFGNRKASNEILVFLDYANPASEALWSEVVKATKSLKAANNKIVVFGKSSEHYGTELMGGGVWTSYSRPEKALEYFTYSLNRWNAVKAAHKRQGKRIPFVYEYDATAQATELPILYSFLAQVKPAVSPTDQVDIVRYAFDAGNVNMYQAVMASKDYGVKAFPAVVVNDVLLTQPSAQAIVKAANRP